MDQSSDKEFGSALGSTSRSQRLAFVDALRGWAILGVIAAHTVLWFPPSSEVTQAIAISGGHGVQLFFVISSFTLLLSLSVKSTTEARPILSYFIRRFFRIAPMFYVFVGIYVLLPDARTFWVGRSTELSDIFLGLIFINGWHPLSINSVVPGGWSIAVEMGFYLLLPIWFRYVKSFSTAFSVTLLCVIVGMGVSWLIRIPFLGAMPDQVVKDFSYFWLPAQLSVFGTGGLLFLIWNRQEISRSKLTFKYKTEDINRDKIIGALPPLICGLYLLAALPIGGGYRFLPQQFLYAIAFFLIAYSLASYAFRPFVNPVTCFIGQVSYSAYFFHFPIIWLFSTLQIMGGYESSGSTLGFLVAIVVITSFTLIFSTLSYFLVERPFIAIGGRIVSLLGRMSKQKNGVH